MTFDEFFHFMCDSGVPQGCHSHYMAMASNPAKIPELVERIKRRRAEIDAQVDTLMVYIDESHVAEYRATMTMPKNRRRKARKLLSQRIADETGTRTVDVSACSLLHRMIHS